MFCDIVSSIGVIGAGAMGTGIAQLAVMNNYPVYITDKNPQIITECIKRIDLQLSKLCDKNLITQAQKNSSLAQLTVCVKPEQFSDCDLIIEAVSEDIDIKTEVLISILPYVSDKTIIATNTSSLSVTEIGRRILVSDRMLGIHFFNPAPFQALVEIIKGENTVPAIINTAANLVTQWGKTVVFAADKPGFIVNRVARPYYLEAWRIFEEGFAGITQIDFAMRNLGNFLMGPFELQDYLGHDLSVAVSKSIWEGFNCPERFKISSTQLDLLKAGHLGRKTGQGAYHYYSHENNLHIKPVPALINSQHTSLKYTDDKIYIIEDFAGAASITKTSSNAGDNVLEQYIFARILAAVICEAYRAFKDKVASKTDIDTAMKLGTKYPMGPFEWANYIGLDKCENLFKLLNDVTEDDRFALPEDIN